VYNNNNNNNNSNTRLMAIFQDNVDFTGAKMSRWWCHLNSQPAVRWWNPTGCFYNSTEGKCQNTKGDHSVTCIFEIPV